MLFNGDSTEVNGDSTEGAVQGVVPYNGSRHTLVTSTT